MTFEYLQRVVVESELEVENIGQCAILGRNDIGEENYLLIRTEMGYTETILYGPVVPDISILPLNVSMTYSRFEYNESKIERLIDRFLNDPKRGISQAEVVDKDELMPLINQSLIKIFQTNFEGEIKDEYTDSNNS